MALNGHWTDFVTEFMNYSAEAPIPPSPDIFRKWAGIALVGGSLGRRVWTKSAMGLTYPNTYILLTGNPGTGKFIIEEVRNLWNEAKVEGAEKSPFHVAPDSMSHASLIDAVKEAKISFLPPKGPPLLYHSLLIPAEEFQVLIPTYTPEYISRLNDLFNNKDSHRETRRTGSVQNIVIERPQISIIGGVTPAYLTSTFPEQAWNTGLARRMIFIYSNEQIVKDLFEEKEWDEERRENLLIRLGQMSQMYGQFKFTNSAAKCLAEWHIAGGPPTPDHSKLVHYNRSRTNLHVLKLSMISAISRTGQLIIEEPDAQRAISWLLEAESFMPGIFRAMVGRSDVEVIEELWLYVATQYKNSKEPIRGAVIAAFLGERCDSRLVTPIWEQAARSEVIQLVAGSQDLWIPGPRTSFRRS